MVLDSLKIKIIKTLLIKGSKFLSENLFKQKIKSLNKINNKKIIKIIKFAINFVCLIFKTSLKKVSKNIKFFLKNRVLVSLKNIKIYFTKKSGTLEHLKSLKNSKENLILSKNNSIFNKKFLYFYRSY